MKTIPSIQKYMITSPLTIGSHETLDRVKDLMSQKHIRHLPVVSEGKVVGIISDRDLTLVATFKDVDLAGVQVADAMTYRPYTVHPEAPLDEVAIEMAEKKYGSVVVVDNGHPVGIFTAVDGLRTLAELLRTRLTK